MERLAILGGPRAVPEALAPYASIGDEEVAAVTRVARTGKLSCYIGAWCDDFDGGPEVKAFERAWADRFRARHAVAVNSNTSGMMAAMGAIGVSPGDEVIVPPTSMSATAMAPLIYGGIPVFVDLEPATFCLDPKRVAEAITPRTRAILVTDLFGHPAALHELRALADRHGIYLVEDAAQAPLAEEHGRYAGTIGHIGVFSLNYHKHFHTGEGGMCVTDNDDLALRLRAIRNHGENVVEPLGIADATNLVGFNLRMTELSATIGIEQLKKADRLVARRVEIADRLTAATRSLPGFTPPVVRSGCQHVYYVWAARYDAGATGVSRARVCEALNAEGVPVWEGYVEPLYLLPLFQRRLAIGRDGWPFTLSERTYPRGLCPVAEKLYGEEFIEFAICSHALDDRELDAVINGFTKVFGQLDALTATAAEARG